MNKKKGVSFKSNTTSKPQQEESFESEAVPIKPLKESLSPSRDLASSYSSGRSEGDQRRGSYGSRNKEENPRDLQKFRKLETDVVVIGRLKSQKGN